MVVSGQVTAPADTGIQDELAADQGALVGYRTAAAAIAARAARIDARAASARLLSDQLSLEESAFALRRTQADDEAEIASLEQRITQLNASLQSYADTAFAPAPVAPVGDEAVRVAEQFLGVPYVWGGASPHTGFDCSGLVQYVYGQLGVALPHYAAAQWAQTMHVDPSQLQAGDLLFFEPRSDGPGHVGIYVGGDTFLEAPHTGDVVKFQSVSLEARAMGFVGASRPAAFGSFG